MVYSDAWGKLIHEKNQKSKISWHCPFKFLLLYYHSKFSSFSEIRNVVILGGKTISEKSNMWMAGSLAGMKTMCCVLDWHKFDAK